MNSQSGPANTADAPSLQRRFTADLSKMPPITPIGQMPNQGQESLEIPGTVSEIRPMMSLMGEFFLVLIFLNSPSRQFGDLD